MPLQQCRQTTSWTATAGTDSLLPLRDLYVVARASVFSQAILITRCRRAAEEVVQDVFTYAWQHGDNYDASKGGYATWLHMLCRSRAIDYLRANRTRTSTEIYGLDIDHLEDQEEPAESRHDATVRAGAISLALRLLPVTQRKLLVMHYYAELSHQEIAEQTRLPLGTVKTTIRRGQMALASSLRPVA